MFEEIGLARRVLSLATVALVAGVLLLFPIWRQASVAPTETMEAYLLGGTSAISFVLAYLLRLLFDIQHSSLVKILLVQLALAFATTQPVLFALMILDLDISRVTVVLQLALLALAVLMTSDKVPAAIPGSISAVAFFALMYAVDIGQTDAPRIEVDDRSFISSSYHDLELRFYATNSAPKSKLAHGGALNLMDKNRLLLVEGTGLGKILTYEENNVSVSQQDLALNIPLDRAPYLATKRGEGHFFRVTDTLLIPVGSGGYNLFAAYSHWDAEQDCFTLRLSQAPWDGESSIPAAAWSLRYETSPCLNLGGYNNEAGGRLAQLDQEHLLLTVGTHLFEGYPEIVDTIDEIDYGRIMKVNLQTWEAVSYSTGHRNAQGLLVGESGVWSTEHGPYGGDEFNEVVEGEDYGWPFAGYGTDYAGKFVTYGELGDHSNYKRPVFSWTPSIGISNLIQVNSSRFAAWKDDFLIGSLQGLGNGYSVYRVRVREGRVITNERIHVQEPVRDLVQLATGQIALWNGTNRVSVLSNASNIMSECSGCHATRFGVHGIGPTLYQIAGSQVARHQSFNYSAALREFGGVWSDDRLDQFLANPMETVPGTSMAHGGIKDAETRAKLINYLREL